MSSLKSPLKENVLQNLFKEKPFKEKDSNQASFKGFYTITFL